MKKSKISKEFQTFLRRLGLAEKLVLKEDEKLLKELAKH